MTRHLLDFIHRVDRHTDRMNCDITLFFFITLTYWLFTLIAVRANKSTYIHIMLRKYASMHAYIFRFQSFNLQYSFTDQTKFDSGIVYSFLWRCKSYVRALMSFESIFFTVRNSRSLWNICKFSWQNKNTVENLNKENNHLEIKKSCVRKK